MMRFNGSRKETKVMLSCQDHQLESSSAESPCILYLGNNIGFGNIYHMSYP